MKKAMYINFIFLILCLGLLTGCGKKSTIEEITVYLNNNYPEEKFEILNKEYIENVDGSCKSDDNSKDKTDGYKYNVISNTTNVEFEVKDTYEKTSYGTCDYHLVDNYYEQALIKYITEFNDSRIKIDTHMFKSDIKVDYKNFKSINELSNVLFNFKTYYEGKKPFEENSEVSIYVYNSDIYLGSTDLSYNNRKITLDNLNNELSNIVQ